MRDWTFGIVILVVATIGVAFYVDHVANQNSNNPQGAPVAQASIDDSPPPRNPAIDAAAAALASKSDGPPTGPGDPYAAGQRALGTNEYEQAKIHLLSKSRMVASAARCRVIANVEANVIGLNDIQSISNADIAAGRSDYHPDLLPAVKAAGAQAYKNAGRPGGCGYWEQHPDAVAEMRREAALATSP